MGFQFHISDVSFNNAICDQIILYPKNKWQLKIITTTRAPSTSSIMRAIDPNMVCYLMKNMEPVQREEKWYSDKKKVLDIFERNTRYFFKRVTYQLWRDMHTISPILFFLGK